MTVDPTKTISSGLNLAPLEIGSVTIDPPVLQAPMAGFTNYAYRQIARRLGGVGLPATEMVSARAFVEMDARQDATPDRLWGVKDEPRPLAVQIWDNDPETLAEVGRRLAREFQVSIVDINFGCPVHRVTENAKSGSYLLRDPQKLGDLVARVVEACRPTPVTAKIRLGPSRDMVNAIDVAQAVEGAGGAALTVHGRTAADMFRGSATWEDIARIKPTLQEIPLVGNGDLRSHHDVLDVFRRYDIDGVMIGRAGLGRPWLFRQVRAALRGEAVPPDPTLAEREQLLREHYQAVIDRFGEARATVLMRKYACCYSQGLPHSREFRNRVSRAVTRDEFLDIVQRHFPKD